MWIDNLAVKAGLSPLNPLSFPISWNQFLDVERTVRMCHEDTHLTATNRVQQGAKY